MKAFSFLQMPEHVTMQSDMIAEIDPHGIIISAISISVIFLSLLILFIAYLLIGKCVKKFESRSNNSSRSTSNAPRMYEEAVHDKESYVITILRKAKDRSHTEYSSGDEFLSTPGISQSAAGDDVLDKGATGNTPDRSLIKSPLPGTITEIKVNVGDKVHAGQEVAILEAMKMENTIEAEHDGSVTEIFVSKGDSVLEGTPIIKII